MTTQGDGHTELRAWLLETERDGQILYWKGIGFDDEDWTPDANNTIKFFDAMSAGLALGMYVRAINRTLGSRARDDFLEAVHIREHEWPAGAEANAIPRRFEPVGSTARALVDAQANDEGLWFIAKYSTEAYLQKALRDLHAAVEGETPAAAATLAQGDGHTAGRTPFVRCSECDGAGVVAGPTFDTYEIGCGTPHGDHGEEPCPECNGTGRDHVGGFAVIVTQKMIDAGRTEFHRMESSVASAEFDDCLREAFKAMHDASTSKSNHALLKEAQQYVDHTTRCAIGEGNTCNCGFDEMYTCIHVAIDADNAAAPAPAMPAFEAMKDVVEEVSRQPCFMPGAEDMESGCCLSCRARAALAASGGGE